MLHAIFFAAAGVAAAAAWCSTPWRGARGWAVAAATAITAAELGGWIGVEVIRPPVLGSLLSLAMAALSAAAAAATVAELAERSAPAVLGRLGLIAIVLLAAALLVLAWLRPYPDLPFYRDSSAYAYLGERLLHGELPHRDYWDQKPGGIAFVDAATLAFGRPPLPSLAWLDLAYSLAIIAAAAWAARPVAGAWATLPALGWLVLFYRSDANFQGGNLTEQYAMLPMLLSAGAALRTLRQEGGAETAAASGVFAGVAGLFKPTAGTALPALLVALAAARGLGLRRRWLPPVAWAIVGGLAVAIAVLAWFILAATPLWRLYDEVVVINRLYEIGLGTDTLRAAWKAVTEDHWPLFIPFLALVAGIVTARSRERAVTAIFFTAAAAADVYGLVLPGYFYGHYFMLLIPTATLVLAWGTESVTQAGVALVRRARLPGAAGLPALACLAVGVLVATHFPTIQMLTPKGAPALLRNEPIPEPDAALLADIRASCAPGRPIFVWAFEPQLYVLSDRPSSTRYIYTTPLQIPGYDNRSRIAELLADLRQRPPCLVIDASPDDAAVPPLDALARASWRPQPDRVSSYLALDAIYEYVDANFRPAEQFNGMSVYRPR